MKPRFALNLSDDHVALLERAEHGWVELGSVRLAEADISAALAALRARVDETGGPLATKVVIPASQILYTRIAAPGPTVAERRAQIEAALEGRTPYAVANLVYDWSGTGADLRVAVVARETLTEAEEFAQAHGLNPVCFVATPEACDFTGEPWFGLSRHAAQHMPNGQTPEPDPVPMVIVPPQAVQSAPQADQDRATDTAAFNPAHAAPAEPDAPGPHAPPPTDPVPEPPRPEVPQPDPEVPPSHTPQPDLPQPEIPVPDPDLPHPDGPAPHTPEPDLPPAPPREVPPADLPPRELPMPGPDEVPTFPVPPAPGPDLPAFSSSQPYDEDASDFAQQADMDEVPDTALDAQDTGDRDAQEMASAQPVLDGAFTNEDATHPDAPSGIEECNPHEGAPLPTDYPGYSSASSLDDSIASYRAGRRDFHTNEEATPAWLRQDRSRASNRPVPRLPDEWVDDLASEDVDLWVPQNDPDHVMDEHASRADSHPVASEASVMPRKLRSATPEPRHQTTAAHNTATDRLARGDAQITAPRLTLPQARKKTTELAQVGLSRASELANSKLRRAAIGTAALRASAGKAFARKSPPVVTDRTTDKAAPTDQTQTASGTGNVRATPAFNRPRNSAHESGLGQNTFAPRPHSASETPPHSARAQTTGRAVPELRAKPATPADARAHQHDNMAEPVFAASHPRPDPAPRAVADAPKRTQTTGFAAPPRTDTPPAAPKFTLGATAVPAQKRGKPKHLGLGLMAGLVVVMGGLAFWGGMEPDAPSADQVALSQTSAPQSEDTAVTDPGVATTDTPPSDVPAPPTTVDDLAQTTDPDTQPVTPTPPPPYEQLARMSADGTIEAREGGTVMPGNFMLYAGKPDLVPQSRPAQVRTAYADAIGQPLPYQDPALAGIRPNPRPANLTSSRADPETETPSAASAPQNPRETAPRESPPPVAPPARARNVNGDQAALDPPPARPAQTSQIASMAIRPGSARMASSNLAALQLADVLPEAPQVRQPDAFDGPQVQLAALETSQRPRPAPGRAASAAPQADPAPQPAGAASPRPPRARPAGVISAAAARGITTQAETVAPSEPVLAGTANAVAVSRRPPSRPNGFAPSTEQNRVDQGAVDQALAAAKAEELRNDAATRATQAALAAEQSAQQAAERERQQQIAAAAARPPAAEETEAEPEPERAAPRLPTSASVAQSATETDAIKLRQLNLIGVFGSSSNRRAMVRTSNGRIARVGLGDRFDGGQIIAIGDDSLTYQKGAKAYRIYKFDK
ncbi:hypothetical protein ERN12_05555 [Rhodobacteraceae bacterium]|nr:hypothetical protein ERN12_05555 [Paracoccaceae bacterium]